MEQKVAFGIFFLVGVGAIIFGFKSFPANLSRPFELQLAEYAQAPEYVTLEDKESREIAAQKVSDTDLDGLTDYDELYVYKTSPYMPDSDSDGFDDKTEVLSGNNPNCPQGQDCGTVYLSAEEIASSGATAADFVGEAPTLTIPGLENVKLTSVEEIMEFVKNIGPDEIRSLLVAQGVSKEYLDSLSDEELQSLYVSAAQEAQASGQLDELISQFEQASP